MTIIGICGFQSAGKDTMADYLINNHGFIKLSFASVLKDIVSIIFSWDREKLEGITDEDRIWREQVDLWWSSELNIPQLTPRYILQTFGTQLFRNHFHNDIWSKVIKNKLRILKNNNIVITDCRFANEIEMIRSYGGIIIHIYRKLPLWFESYKNGIHISSEIDNIHISELIWIREKFDYEISNTENKEKLYEKIKNLYLKINNN